ncbi:hypothetical protein SAMN04489717_4800 [Actinopolymorpha singaporensis]|uniref:Uncharacterized protein n=1 Tax=Actinopolymorpha singaporensis TaxID=117157 RepID=A0A1H1X3K7_9ACTN|nr:hypothetical protein SAMN04489717_4800 [Actinopolymorpha singaporensis]
MGSSRRVVRSRGSTGRGRGSTVRSPRTASSLRGHPSPVRADRPGRPRTPSRPGPPELPVGTPPADRAVVRMAVARMAAVRVARVVPVVLVARVVPR